MRKRLRVAGITIVTMLVSSGIAFGPSAYADNPTATYRIVSTNASGVPGDNSSGAIIVTPDLRYVLFESQAVNLVPAAGDQPGGAHVYVADTVAATVSQVDLTAGGAGLPEGGFGEGLSDDGRYVLYRHTSSNGTVSVLVDRITGVATTPCGNFDCGTVRFSLDDHYMVFATSNSSNTLPGGFDESHVYIYDLQTHNIAILDPGAPPNNAGVFNPQFGPGHWVYWNSSRTDVVAGAGGSHDDLFRENLDTSVTQVIDTTADGTPGDKDVDGFNVSGDGRYVAFDSLSDNLVPGDADGQWRPYLKDLQTGAIVALARHGSGPQYVTGVGALYETYGGFTADDSLVVCTQDPQYVPQGAGAVLRHPDGSLRWFSRNCVNGISQDGTRWITGVDVSPDGTPTSGGQVALYTVAVAPLVTVTGVVDGASYALNTVPSARCAVSDPADGQPTVAAVITDPAGPNAAAGLGTVTVTCAYTDSVGLSGSASATYTIVATVPATPTIASVAPGDHTATVTWLKPDDGGSPILGYTVTAAPGGQSCSTTSADDLSCTITGLTNGVNYTFTVTAHNDAGNSPPPASGGTGDGTSVGSGTPGTPPAPVTGVQPTPNPDDGTEVTLHWLAAASDLPITGYTATAAPGGQSCSTTGDLFCTITGLTPGQDYTFTVVAINGTGSSDPSDPVRLPPAVTAISPNSGLTTGGATVTITGTALTDATGITFGTTPATGVTCTAASCTVTVPARAIGPVDVRVTTTAGTSAITAADRYTYVPPAPTVTTVSPAHGPIGGGTLVTISGTHLTGTTAVHFGSTAATGVSVINDTTVQATAPAGAGIVDVTVTAPGGTSAIAGTDRYTYDGADLAVGAVATTAAIGSLYTETITVTNNGPLAATGVHANTTLSGATHTVPNATTSQGTCTISSTAVNCTIGNLAAGATATVTLRIEPETTGTITATTTASGAQADPITANNTAVAAVTAGTANHCTIIGTPGNDTINGTGGPDVICGLGGNDTISGRTGNITIYAGSGTNTIAGGSGHDTIYGGYGIDIIAAGSGSNDIVYSGGYLYPGAANDTIDGGSGHTTCYITHTDHVSNCTTIIYK